LLGDLALLGYQSSSLAFNSAEPVDLARLDYLCGSPDMLCFCVRSEEGLAVAVVLIAYQQPFKPANVELIPTMALSTIEPS
jgi:hypothetical protein